MSVTNGSPALKGLMSSEDSAIAGKLRDAGAVLIGKTNMPPMAAGGMQRGLYGRAESPYNEKYLTGAFSSGSSNGAATSVASSMAVFGMGSETVSSGRSPASNNALVCYTPSKGLLSCRGLWPLYVTCDVPTPYARSMDDMLELLNVIATPDQDVTGDFIREQPHVQIPKPPEIDYTTLRNADAFKGKRIGVPKMYVGGHDSDPNAKHPFVSDDVIALWASTAKRLESLGAEIIYTDFPLVTNYENDSLSSQANNVQGCPANWNALERGVLIAQAWDSFLVTNNDDTSGLKSLADIPNTTMLFPKPKDYKPDTFLEVRNWIDYANLPSLVQKGRSIHDVDGMRQALLALEGQRKRDLEDWMDGLGLDVLAFPAQGDVGLADLEFDMQSTTHSLQNGVKYSNGNRVLRHLGVPTVSVCMGVGEEKGMPVNVTFAGRGYTDRDVLVFAWAFEHATKARVVPARVSALKTDLVGQGAGGGAAGQLLQDVTAKATNSSSIHNEHGKVGIQVHGSFYTASQYTTVQLFADGEEAYNQAVSDAEWTIALEHGLHRKEVLGWDLKPLPKKDVMIIVVVTRLGGKDGDGGAVTREARLLWVPILQGLEG